VGEYYARRIQIADEIDQWETRQDSAEIVRCSRKRRLLVAVRSPRPPARLRRSLPPATPSADSNQQSEPNEPSSVNSDKDSSTSKMTIIRFGCSLPKTTNQNEPLPLLSEEGAEMFSRLVV
jgi:hypothetical protein